MKQSLASIFQFRRESFMRLAGLGGSQAIIVVLGILCSSILARQYSKADFGSYQLLCSLFYMISPFCLSGMNQSLLLSSSRGMDGNFRPIMRMVFGAHVLAGLVLASLCFYYRTSQPELCAPLLIMAALTPMLGLQNVWMPWMNGKGAFNSLAVMQILPNLANPLVLLAAGLCLEKNLVLLVCCMIGSTSLSHVILCYYTGRTHVHNDARDPGILRYGLHFSALSVMGGIIFADKVILNAKFSVEEVAVYSVALAFLNLGKSVNAIIVRVMSPEIYKAADAAKAWRVLRPKWPKLLALSAAMGVLGYAIMPWALVLVFSVKYEGALDFARGYWLLSSASLPLACVTQLLQAQKSRLFNAFSLAVYPIMLLVMYLALVHLGIVGILLARVLCIAVLMVVAVVALRQLLLEHKN